MMVQSSPNQIAIFWDFENCRPSSSITSSKVVNNILRLVQGNGIVTTFRAYIDLSRDCANSREVNLHSDLQLSGVTLVHCPHNVKKDVADKMMIVDMLAFAIDRPVPATVVLITGDRDFAYAAAALKLRGYRIIAISPSTSHATLTVQAHEQYDWRTDVLETSHAGSDPGQQRPGYLDSSVPLASAQDVSVVPTSVSGAHPDVTSQNGSLKNETITATGRQSDSLTAGSRISSVSNGLHIPAPPSFSDPSFWAAGVPGSHETAEIIRSYSSPSTPSTVSSDVDTEWEWATASAISEIEFVAPASKASLIPEPTGTSSHEPTSPVSVPSDHGLSSSTDLARDVAEDAEEASTGPRPEERTADSTATHLQSVDSANDDKSSPTDFQEEPNVAELLINGRPYDSPESVFASGIPASPGASTSPTSISTGGEPVPIEEDRLRFRTLIEYFIDRRATNQTALVLASDVAQEILRRDEEIYEKAGVADFMQYVNAAREAGVAIDTYLDDGRGWLDINPVLYPRTQDTEATETTASASIREQTDSSQIPIPAPKDRQRFQALITFFLNRRAANQPTTVIASEVAQKMSEKRKQVYKEAGVTKFGPFVEAARKAGVIIEPGLGSTGNGWLELNPALYQSVQGSAATTPTAATSSQPSSSSRSNNPTLKDRQRFQALITFFLNRKAANQPITVIASEVAQKMSEKGKQAYKEAGVTKFRPFVEAARKAGVIIGPGLDGAGNGWLELNPALYQPAQGSAATTLTAATSSQPSSSSRNNPTLRDRQRFRALITFFLNRKAANQPTTVIASEVAQKMSGKGKQAYKEAGVSKFRPFVKAARKAGVIIGPGLDSTGNGWLELNPALYQPAQGLAATTHTAAASSQPSSSSQNNNPTREDCQRFRSLISLFLELRATNQPTRIPVSGLAQTILKKDKQAYKEAGVTKFKSFVKAASKAGVIFGPGSDHAGNGWLELNPALYQPAQDSAAATTHTAATSPQPSSSSRSNNPTREDRQRFRSLISLFLELRATNQPTRIPVSGLAQEILKKDKQAYGKAGVRKFKPFVEAAKEAGVVLGPGFDGGGKGWLKLNPVLYASIQDAGTSTSSTIPRA